jgi:excinuclease UvrABC nuclease subunit
VEQYLMQLEGFLDVSVLLRCGVYALCRRGVVIYVGKSKSLYARIYTHKHFANRGAKGKAVPSWLPVKGLQFDEVFIRPCRLEELDELEAAMINLYKPKYNESLKNNLKVRVPINLVIGGILLQMNTAPRPQVGLRR